MIDLKELINKVIASIGNADTILSDPYNHMFAVTNHSLSHAISANGNGQIALNVTKSGYYPVGVIGYDIAGTMSTWLFPFKMGLTNKTTGSARIYCNLKNTGSSASNGTMSISVLWITVGGVLLNSIFKAFSDFMSLLKMGGGVDA